MEAMYVPETPETTETFYSLLPPCCLYSHCPFKFYDLPLFCRQRIREYTTDRIAALLIEQHSLENHLNSVHQYFSQLQSDYELRQVLHGICTSEHGVVYAYNTQMYSLLSNLKLYDTNIRSISIYTENETASKILKEFFPMEEQPFLMLLTRFC